MPRQKVAFWRAVEFASEERRTACGSTCGETEGRHGPEESSGLSQREREGERGRSEAGGWPGMVARGLVSEVVLELIRVLTSKSIQRKGTGSHHRPRGPSVRPSEEGRGSFEGEGHLRHSPLEGSQPRRARVDGGTRRGSPQRGSGLRQGAARSSTARAAARAWRSASGSTPP